MAVATGLEAMGSGEEEGSRPKFWGVEVGWAGARTGVRLQVTRVRTIPHDPAANKQLDFEIWVPQDSKAAHLPIMTFRFTVLADWLRCRSAGLCLDLLICIDPARR
jgi:hypothetical protein